MGTKIGAILDPQTADKWAVEAVHIKRPYIDLGEAGAAVAVDPTAATRFVVALAEASAALTLGAAPAGVATEIRLVIHRSGSGARAIVWPASVVWLSGAVPDLGSVSGVPDVIELMTYDGGVSWYGYRLGAASAAVVTPDLPIVSISDAELITDEDEDLPIVSISDAVLVITDPAAILTASPASLAFPDVVPGETATLTVTVTNTGDAAATITGFSVTGAAFVAEFID